MDYFEKEALVSKLYNSTSDRWLREKWGNWYLRNIKYIAFVVLAGLIGHVYWYYNRMTVSSLLIDVFVILFFATATTISDKQMLKRMLEALPYRRDETVKFDEEWIDKKCHVFIYEAEQLESDEEVFFDDEFIESFIAVSESKKEVSLVSYLNNNKYMSVMIALMAMTFGAILAEIGDLKKLLTVFQIIFIFFVAGYYFANIIEIFSTHTEKHMKKKIHYLMKYQAYKKSKKRKTKEK